MSMDQRASAKNCPECGQPMTPRTDQSGGEFLGCSAWPECQHREPLPQDILMRRENAPELPGLSI